MIEKLKAKYPDPACALEYETDPWKLLVMARLSAQCTDKRVNEVCKTLFVVYPDAEKMAEAGITDIENIVKPCGLYRAKAESIKMMSSDIVNKYDGKVPGEMDKLLAMRGVGRKIANLVLGDAFGIDGIVADTHCIRISNRLGLVSSVNPEKVEKELCSIVPYGERGNLCHRIVWYGREVCKARNPICGGCAVKDICKKHIYNK